MADVFEFEDYADLENTEEVVGGGIIPRGLYRVEIVENNLGGSRPRPEEGKESKLMASVAFRVIEPVQYAGSVLFENFVLASDAAPKVFDKTTFGSRRWKTMLAKANVALGSSLRQAAAMSVKQQLFADVTVKKDAYQGNEREVNRIQAFFSVTERQPQLREAENGGTAANVAAAANPAAPPAPVAPAPAMNAPQVVPPAPQTAAPQPMMPPAAAPAAPTVTFPTSPPVAVPASPASPTLPSPQPYTPVPQQQQTANPQLANPQPVAPPPANPNAAPQPQQPTANEPTVPCMVCNASVPASQFEAHMKAHQQGN